jgi:hypothetical protein
MEDSWERAKEIKKWLKIEWADLWINKHEDEIRAEGVSAKEYSCLYVDEGEIIHATRDFKPLSFREILEKHVGKNSAERVDIDPKVGGWKKFARQNFPANKKVKREKHRIKNDLNQPQRKNGAGWRNQARIFRKLKENTQ